MKKLLFDIVGMIAEIHNQLLKANDKFELYFTDKQLHFLVIGVIGMLMIFVVYPIFKYLAKRNHIMTISWIYVFTLILVLTFAIEIGQKITGTGAMEFADIMFGVVGFLFMFCIFAIIRSIFHGVQKLIGINEREREEENSYKNNRKVQYKSGTMRRADYDRYESDYDDYEEDYED